MFGVSSDEYLQYAIKNREEWELQGEDVVAGIVEKCRKKYGFVGPDGSVVRSQESTAPNSLPALFEVPTLVEC